jgi:muramoyltetrapeptide carboxypeptidase LdcA involved in peptidoglycan recycling
MVREKGMSPEMQSPFKPKKLEKGDTVALVTSSWGGPATYPKVYEHGKELLTSIGFHPIEMPRTLSKDELLYNNPKLRAEDLNDAFLDPEIKGIISAIGGDDSIRILEHLDVDVIRNNPKFFLGYSDTTTQLIYLNTLGLVTYHGPSVMAGFSQLNNFPVARQRMMEFLFENPVNYEYQPFDKFCHGYPDWSKPENLGKINVAQENSGWNWLQQGDNVEGPLFGGCLEVMEFMKSTPYWPEPEFWDGKILFFETSEDLPNVFWAKLFLRNYGIQGVFDRIQGLLFGRPRDMDEKQIKSFEQTIVDVVASEFKQTDVPIVTNFDMGHTDPQYIMPLGIRMTINCDESRIYLAERPFVN